jgi:hypothetical protein
MSKKNWVYPPLTTNGRQPGKKQTDNETTLEKKQLTGDNPVKNRQTRGQPWKKQLTGDNPVKNRQTRRQP